MGDFQGKSKKKVKLAKDKKYIGQKVKKDKLEEWEDIKNDSASEIEDESLI